ncbi:hypothetical protein IW261DRAFT_1447708 [Armillaria novae-zelandiae]|uniref:Zn(2)-C6 fungal-type domain-containing protein n=1 Tax=Armillaria novae-zelandiae TaxID=153914 RepID=A0AA39PQK0_9AGAR|nr:hypothetical protein IW261DRAFT_1447708 [Armillaria novae-zelandiae]
MYAIGEPSRSRDDPDAPTYRPMSSYYYSSADIVEHSHTPDTRNFRVKHMGSRQVQEYNDHMDGHLDGPRQMLSFNGHRQYPVVSDTRLASSSSPFSLPGDASHSYYTTSHSEYSSNINDPPNLVPASATVPRSRRVNFSTTVDTSVSDLQRISYGYMPMPESAITDRSYESSDAWSPQAADAPPPTPEQMKPRKPRREKPRIALAPDQPPTTQGKPRARVYVACIQCRSRKIRCDGAKPVCHNCGRRTNGSNECTYDPVPKRRGPDKTPGARQRMARELRMELERENGGASRRRRRRSDSITHKSSASPTSANLSDSARSRSGSLSRMPLSATLSSPSSSDHLNSPGGFGDMSRPQHPYASAINGCACHNANPCPLGIVPNDVYYPKTETIDSSGFVAQSNESENGIVQRGFYQQGYSGSKGPQVQNISSQPSSEFTRKTWWDSILSLYLSPPSDFQQTRSRSDRDLAVQAITADLRFLFRSSNYWFSFFHLPTFFGNYSDPVRRHNLQPSLILAALAVSTFWQSSDVGLGKGGRDRALRLRDKAQGALESSFNSGWIDETLAQAAWLLALFEVCAHPTHTRERAVSSLVMLDSYIRSLSLTFVDADDPQTSHFSPGAVPSVAQKPGEVYYNSYTTSSESQYLHHNHYSSSPSPNGSVECVCASLSLGVHYPETLEHAPLWAHTPAWNSHWSEGDIRRESCRRLCWSALSLAAGHVAYANANHHQGPELFISDPSNYALLFSGESMARSPSLSYNTPKDTIWALFDRSFLLWHGCVRMRHDHTATEAEQAQFTVKAWLEADAIEANLNRHTCAIERSFIFQAREYIFNTRMCISYEFQRFIPLISTDLTGLIHRKKAEEWLTHQSTVAQRYMFGLHAVTGNANNHLARRPFFVFWFMSQVLSALSLWQYDNSLTIALDVCKAFLPAIDYLTTLWPCSDQRRKYDGLRERLGRACSIAGLAPPPKINLGLPAISNDTIL